MAIPFLSNSELGEELVPLGAPRTVAQHEASTASRGDQSEAEGSLLSNHSRQTAASKKRLSLSPRYEFKSQSIKATPCALSGKATTLHKQLRVPFILAF